jgi:signal transduction histidine kinase
MRVPILRPSAIPLARPRITRAHLIAVVLAPAAIVAVLGVAMLREVRAAADRDSQVDRTLELTRVLADLRARLTDVQAAERGFALTGADRYLAPARGAADDVGRDLQTVRGLVGNDSGRRAHADTLARLANAEFALVNRAVAVHSHSALGRALTAMDGEDAMLAIRRTVAALDRDARSQLTLLRRVAGRQRTMALAATAGGTAAAVLLALLATTMLSVLVDRRDQAVAALDARTRQLLQQTTALEAVATALRGANEAKSEFLSTMSHELRTPLTAIEGYAELMQMELHGPVTDEQREDLQRMRRAGAHLLKLVTHILDYAKLESGRVHVEAENLPIDETLRAAGAMIELQARAKGVTYHYEPCDPTRTARGDRDKVRQIVLNLLSNAVKFTDVGGSVTLACEPGLADRENNTPVRITVHDTGRGIPPEILESIFEPYVQVGRRADSAEGVGLGLPISRALAYAMGGDILVTSQPGIGSTFALTLQPGATST